MKRLFTLMFCALVAMTVSAQRHTDKLDRGVVAVPASTGGGFLVTWRIFGEEYYGVTYNLYANGTKIASNLKVSNYTHAGGNASTKYQVSAVVNGVEQSKSQEVKPWTAGYLQIPMANVVDRKGNDVTSQYEINDASLGDVDGDGVAELMVKRNYTGGDLNTTGNTTKFHHYECYKMDGTRLWWIDMGPNMMAGPDEQWDIIAFDWDEDGKAEYVFRGADNMIIHTSTGVDLEIGNMSYVAPRDEYTRNGNEYLLYVEGATGKPYAWDGSKPAFTPMAYPLPRFEAGESDYEAVWGKNDTGHRSSKHYFGAPCLDGRHHSIFLGRGCYTRHKMCALDVDPATHKLTQRWRWNEYNGGPWFGCGYHNYIIADVDEDGRDEIVFGSMVIDDNGKGLSTTGLGHGDAEHCGDFDPYRKGLEFFGCNESSPNMNYRNATTSKMYYRSKGTSDDGRALCGNFTNDFPGCQGRSVNTALISTVADKEIQGGPAIGGTNDALFWSHLNFRIYWTGDLLEGVLDSPGTMREAVVYTPANGRVFQSSGCALNNSSKNNPCATGDVIGDWREEILARTGDNKYIRVYTTPIATNYRIPTLWHDHEYRNAMVWQCIGYNQPPHTSYFLGQLEGITQAPPPYTMTGREEISDGETISSAYNGKQVIVCETKNTNISITDGAAPFVTFFNVPSWVQGTNSSKTDGTAVINYDYFTCNVTGGALAGNGRLVKQGDGILNLPKVDMTYTGPTDVWAGKVNFDGSLLKSTVWLNRFAELNSNGGKFRSIKMNYASVLRPGGENNVGELTTDSLTLGFGARVVIDVDNTLQKADLMKIGALIVEKKTGSVWESYGPKYLNPVFEINTGTEDGKLTEGKYKIMTLTKMTGSIKDIIIEGIDASQKNYLLEENGSVYLVIEGLREATDVVWNGANGNVWNMATTENFTLASDPSSTNNIFVSGDNVTFNDDASQLNVSLQGDIVAGTVLVNSSKTYSFSGTGKLIGKTAFAKEGTGTVTMNNDNTYTGGNRISGGTVKVNSLSNDTQEYGNLGGVTSAATKFVIENGGTLMNTANVTMGSPMKMDGDEGGCLNTQANFNMNKIITGTLLTKKGSGSLILFGSNTLKKMIIQAGYVDMRAGAAANAIELQGGTLIDNASNTTHPIVVPKGKTATWQLSGTYYLAYANKITGEGTLTINPTNTVSRVRITGNWSEFTGTIKHTNTNIWLPLDASTGLPKGTLNIASGCTVTNVCKTFTIGKLTGAGDLAHPVANFQNSQAVTGSNTWKVGNSDESLGDFTYEGKITDGGGGNKANFEKIGTCKMTVKGAWDNTGTVKVSAGTLHTVSKSSLGKGALTVAAGATLSGSATLANTSITIQGTINPGLSITSPSGNMDCGGKNMTVSSTGELIVCARKCATESNPGCSNLINLGRMTMNGMVTVIPYSGHDFKVGDYIRVWEANTNAGSPKLNPHSFEIEPGLYWDDSRLNEGLLYVTDQAPVGIQNIEVNSDVKAQILSLGGAILESVEGKYADIDQLVGKTNIPNGVYVIRISDGKAVKTRKIVIRH